MRRAMRGSSIGPLLVWLVVFGGVFLVMKVFIEARQTPAMTVQTQGNGEIAITRAQDGHYRLRGEINGEPVTFMIDTGATAITLPQPLAQRLGLPRGQTIVSHTANGTVEGYATQLDSLRIGNMLLRQVRAGVVPNMPGGEVLLGMNVLGRMEVVMRGERMILRPIASE
ncbi:TIGR02281 family clan AA aspartic protease [Chitiniphilus purpureus]|uniref:TIGR02281 family clan AA aspartic protease n=1 Tax=Chitiniphilus purpureus TaxID=2981137 RepID=A0ABY6DIA5_9NEIS|nr:TIGR02281 family clan AA aspartic protease [Chitiniphilus sp. CD1]UXY14077.1 TIGR02281 family clan AA aspartic protease [Chitiniphilus sp. CD1]